MDTSSLVAQSFTQALKQALHNIDVFDTERVSDPRSPAFGMTRHELFDAGLRQLAVMRGWTEYERVAVEELRKVCPPDRIYRVEHGGERVCYGLIVAYKPPELGRGARAGVLSLRNGAFYGADLEDLTDVTAQARRGELVDG